MTSSLVVGAVMKRIRDLEESGGTVLRVGNLDTKRDFVAVEDVVDGYVRMMHAECWGEVFNLCSGVPRLIREVVDEIIALSSRTMKIVVDPVLCRADDIPLSYGSFAKAQTAFGFAPRTSLRECLKTAWEFSAGLVSR